MQNETPRNKVKKNEKVYFTEQTEDAIVAYNNATDSDERERIFIEYIAYPLDKLSENVINRFKFPYINQSFEDTKKQVVSFLVINLKKYDKSKAKAFSYFSVIAKNYLIYHNNNGYKDEKRSFSISDSVEEETISVESSINNLEAPNRQGNEDVREFINIMITYWEGNVHKHFKKRRDTEIANAVIELFRRVENIENFNKKALYLMIREMISDCKTGYITKVVNKMKSVVREQMTEYYSEGTINPKESAPRKRLSRK